MAANVRDLRRRIKSVKSTQQITRAMKLVAASKLRRAQENMQNARPYAKGSRELMARLSRLAGDSTNPLMERRPVKRTLLVLITGDRGLAGSFNANVLRTAVRYLRDRPNEDITLELLGRKGRDFFKKRPWPIRGSRVDVTRKLSFDMSAEIAADLIHAFTDGGFDQVILLSNRFKTVMTQDLTFETLLPVGGEASTETASIDYITEPDPAQLVDAIVPRVVETLVHQALLESDAAENGARMVAMENATRNAGEMIERLTLQMNRTRQASITTEIIEIVSGATALGG